MFPIKDTVQSRSFPVVNWLIIIANLLVFVAVELPFTPQQLQQFFFRYGLIPAELIQLSAGAVLTIFTSMFLHGGWLHIISNLWALYIFGDNVEDRMGSGRYFIFFLISGVAAALVQVYVTPASSIPMIGASGAIAGVLGAYLVLYPSARVITLVPIFFFPWFVEIPALIYLAIWIFSQFFSGVMSLGVDVAEGVAYWAHVGGFICGLLLVSLFARRKRPYYRWYPDEYKPW